MRRLFSLLPLLIGLLLGCSSAPQKTAPEYQTVSKDLNRDPERARRLNSEAVALINRGQYDEAEKKLKQALAADVMFGPGHNNLGKVYYQRSQFYLAAWEFEYASKLMPNQPEPKSNLGLVFEVTGKLDEAVKSYDQAMKLEPDNPQFIGNLARARIRRGEHNGEVRLLLDQLVMRDTRPDWVEWAKQKLTLMPRSTTAPSMGLD